MTLLEKGQSKNDERLIYKDCCGRREGAGKILVSVAVKETGTGITAKRAKSILTTGIDT